MLKSDSTLGEQLAFFIFILREQIKKNIWILYELLDFDVHTQIAQFSQYLILVGCQFVGVIVEEIACRSLLHIFRISSLLRVHMPLRLGLGIYVNIKIKSCLFWKYRILNLYSLLFVLDMMIAYGQTFRNKDDEAIKYPQKSIKKKSVALNRTYQISAVKMKNSREGWTN